MPKRECGENRKNQLYDDEEKSPVAFYCIKMGNQQQSPE
jgi:hypothetical protein